MDLLRSCYSAKMRFYQDNCERLLDVNWYFVERTDFVPSTAYCSSVYDELPDLEGLPVGELAGTREHRTGTIPVGTGIAKKYKGTVDQWGGDINLADRVRPGDLCSPVNTDCNWATQCFLEFTPPRTCCPIPLVNGFPVFSSGFWTITEATGCVAQLPSTLPVTEVDAFGWDFHFMDLDALPYGHVTAFDFLVRCNGRSGTGPGGAGYVLYAAMTVVSVQESLPWILQQVTNVNVPGDLTQSFDCGPPITIVAKITPDMWQISSPYFPVPVDLGGGTFTFTITLPTPPPP